ncbi:hypothetical protein BdWA1_003194 [Babesia duncani]|uniref:Uncharacterized protein n=1 Tax=Babesia duncani TaxID=323732 RepID=A0AAD9UMX6_9APIC|nr:hypothetical protein BdWA1_003194 [Babesia duncani]
MTQLYDVLKLHSIDSDDLMTAIIDLISRSPALITQCNVDVLDCLSKFKLPPPQRGHFEKLLYDITMRCSDVEVWSRVFMIAARSSDNRAIVECFISSFRHVLRNSFKKGVIEKGHVPPHILLNVLKGQNTLQRRLSSGDLVIKGGIANLDILWPSVEHQLHSFNSSDMITIATCYFEALGIAQHQTKQEMRGCLNVLMKAIEKRSGEFLLKDWICILNALDKISCLVVSNVLSPDPGNYYVKVSSIQEVWTRKVAESLNSMDIEDLANVIYSLSFPQCSDLCKYLTMVDMYVAPLDAAIERRAIAYVGSNKHTGSRNIFDFYIAQLQMLLPDKNGLRIALDSRKSLEQVLVGMPTCRISQLLPLTRFSEVDNAKMLLNILSDRVRSNLGPTCASEIAHLLEYGVKLQSVGLCDSIIALNAPRMLESRGGFCQLLELSRLLAKLQMPSESFLSSPAATLDELLTINADAHVSHLTLSYVHCHLMISRQLELLLRCFKRRKFQKPLVASILSHAMELDLSLVSQANILDMVRVLGDLGIRHESLVKRLEDW